MQNIPARFHNVFYPLTVEDYEQSAIPERKDLSTNLIHMIFEIYAEKGIAAFYFCLCFTYLVFGIYRSFSEN